jgi:threonine dehydrogenase-like Zn-dependent dehydrogenase
MRGVRNTDVGIRVVDTPDSPTDGVRVSVASSGICGSDLHLVSFGPSTVTLGHEFSGLLDDGTPVSVLPSVRCGRCESCLAGQEQQCPAALSTTYGVSLDGGLADEVWVDPSCAKVVPATLPLDQACLVEPLAVAVHGVRRAGVTPGTRALVIGAGPIGLCTVAVARRFGATVDLLAHRATRQEAGERLGAVAATGTAYDVVLDAAGTQGSMDRAVGLVRPGGTIGVLASFWEPVAIGMALMMKEVTLVPAFGYGHHHQVCEFEDAMAMLADLPDLAETVITHHFCLDDAAEAFRTAGDRDSGAIKVVVHP